MLYSRRFFSVIHNTFQKVILSTLIFKAEIISGFVGLKFSAQTKIWMHDHDSQLFMISEKSFLSNKWERQTDELFAIVIVPE